ncbi:MAG: hypothetical protein MUP63_00135 [Candidatus Nanohaloarchaeota archaeon QJJ-7]|nr:hypothetical protein [Candidatus Nanohaloarchaeota archaeon QJJ-7]
MRKGQVALEYMAIIGLALLVSTPLIIEVQTSSQDLRDSFQNGLAKNALNNAEEAASLVNSQGPPAKVTFRIRLPDGITQTNVSDSYLYIQRRMGATETDFYNTVDFNVKGDLPETSGVHTMVAEAEPNHVNITEK